MEQGLKIATIGGGSSYTPELVEGLINRRDELPVRELWLVDIEAGREKLEIVGALAQRMVARAGNPFKVVLTLDREEALKGAALWDEVKDKLKESAYALSGGQQQRLCIARAMAVEPSVLLMDEPASALDPISTAKIEELICDLSGRTTVVIVTHSMQQAARVSNKTAFFYLGEMVEYGETKKIFTNPDQEATQNYITGRFG